MTPFEAYGMFLAMKAHFTRDNYNYVQYNGKVKTNYDKFMKRNDRFMFYKLSKKEDPEMFVLANLVANEDAWINDILDLKGENIYKQWKKTQETLTYKFKEDVSKLSLSGKTFEELVEVKDGDYPIILKEYQRGNICLETLMIINDVSSIFKYWNKNIKDDLIWPSLHAKMKKYRTFLTLQHKHEQFIQIIVDF